VHPPPSPAQPNFTLMTECTPESRRYYSVYSVDPDFSVSNAADMASDTDLWVVVDGSERLKCMLVLHKGHKSKLLEKELLIYRLARKQADVFLGYGKFKINFLRQILA
jgi:hypothetical protein